MHPAANTHLVAIDLQQIFADPNSPWGSPSFPEAFANIGRLAGVLGRQRVHLTRWLPTADRSGAWGDYFRAWPFADESPQHPLYQLVPQAAELSSRSTVDAATFGKWVPELVAQLGVNPHVVLTGVATDCCVISTALAAADAGAYVTVVRDACADSTAANGAAAVHVMGLYEPQIRLVTTAQLLTELAGGS